MSELTIIKKDGSGYIDSREVAEVIGKRHDNLLRDIDGYLQTLEKSNVLKIEGAKFFIRDSYSDTKGEKRPRYLISKMGCEMVANKLTGEKGVLFTAAYVTRFNEMEACEKLIEKALYQPRLCEFNAAVRLIIPAMRRAGATPKQVIDFLHSVYEPLGIIVVTKGFDGVIRTWSASEIARMLGVYSVNGNPHKLAISAVVYMLGVGDKHKSLVPVQSGIYTGFCVRYDSVAAALVKDWFEEHSYPAEIVFGNRIFKLRYSK